MPGERTLSRAIPRLEQKESRFTNRTATPVTVKKLEELTLALKTKRPGDLVEVIFLRAGKTQQAQATLQQRK